MNMTKVAIAAIKPPTTGRDYHRDPSTPGLLLQVTPTGAMSWQLYKKIGGMPKRCCACFPVASMPFIAAFAFLKFPVVNLVSRSLKAN